MAQIQYMMMVTDVPMAQHLTNIDWTPRGRSNQRVWHLQFLTSTPNGYWVLRRHGNVNSSLFCEKQSLLF